VDKKIIIKNQMRIAVINDDEVLIHDSQSALDFIMSISYNDSCNAAAINKEALSDDFFVLSTGVAGEILQKAVNYRMKLAIIGDFSEYTSKPLNDFIYECNNGRDIFFVNDEDAAVSKLCRCLKTAEEF